MNEMLGNQYFLARKYSNAVENFEKALIKEPENKAIRCKQIICYTQIGEIRKALEMFISMVADDVQYILNTDPIIDDCPCPELIFNLESNLPYNKDSFDYQLTLGMLWLYCDINKSILYFTRAAKLLSEDSTLKNRLYFIISNLKNELSE